MSKVIIAGPRDFNDYEVVKQAIEASNFEITEVVSGCAKGVDSLGEKWAEENNVPIKKFPAEWKNMDLPGAVPKKNKWGVYNATAGLYRNGQMAEYGDKLIAIVMDTNGTNDMVYKMKAFNKEVFEFDPRIMEDDEAAYVF